MIFQGVGVPTTNHQMEFFTCLTGRLQLEIYRITVKTCFCPFLTMKKLEFLETNKKYTSDIFRYQVSSDIIYQISDISDIPLISPGLLNRGHVGIWLILGYGRSTIQYPHFRYIRYYISDISDIFRYIRYQIFDIPSRYISIDIPLKYLQNNGHESIHPSSASETRKR